MTNFQARLLNYWLGVTAIAYVVASVILLYAWMIGALTFTVIWR